MIGRTPRAIACAIALTVAASPVSADPPGQPLPEFAVAAPAGGEIASGAMSLQDRWLLVYVKPGCAPCNSLLESFGRWQSPELLARTILVVGAPVADAAAYLESALPPDVRSLTWYADPERAAWDALKLGATPTLFGVREGRIEWRLAGVLNNPNALKSVVRTWVEGLPTR